MRLSEGFGLRQLFSIIQIILEQNKSIKEEFKKNTVLFLQHIINIGALIRKYKIIFNQNYLYIDNYIFELFEMFRPEELNDAQYNKSHIIYQIIHELNEFKEDVHGIEFIIELLMYILIPKPVSITVKMQVLKNHEDYVMKTNIPQLHISELGTTMKDIMRKIESFLGKGLDLDLLVNNKLITNLDLPISLVYKKIWLQQGKDTNSMTVNYRIKGLFGEAEEDQVENLPDEDQEKSIKLSQYLAQPIQS